jgi:hypothetical protein
VRYTGGWSIEPPKMPAAIGRRSEAPRVLSERLGADGRFVVSLEGIAGRSYPFRVRTPDAATAVALAAVVSNGGRVELSHAPSAGASADRVATIAFPSQGANGDGYTAVTVTLGRRPPA